MAELLTSEEQNALLRIARETIIAHVTGNSIPVFAKVPKGLNSKTVVS